MTARVLYSSIARSLRYCIRFLIYRLIYGQ